MDTRDNASRGAWGCLTLLWETKSLYVLLDKTFKPVLLLKFIKVCGRYWCMVDSAGHRL